MNRHLKIAVIGLAVVALIGAGVYLWPATVGVAVAILAPPVLVGVVFGYRVPEGDLKKWSKAHGVPITPENRPLIVRYLTRGRRIRATGAVMGLIGYNVVVVRVGGDEVSWGVLRSVFFGYLIGAAVAEVWALRLRPEGRPAASLSPREMTDYVPRYAVVLLRAVPLTLVALAVAWHWIPTGRPSDGFDRPGVGSIAMWAGISVGVGVFVDSVARRIVRRPQPAVAPGLLRVDDAIRSSSIHQLAGAGLALVLGILSARLGDLAHGPGGLERAFGILRFVTGAGSLVAWLYLGVDQYWVVRRSRRGEPVAA